MFNAYYYLVEDLQGAKEVDFRKMYLEFNEKYFKNKLPPNLLIELKNLRGVGGSAWREVDRLTGLTTPTKIQISSRYKRDPIDFAKILLHEMIHVLFYVTYPNRKDYARVFAGADGGHNHVFMDKLKEISEMSGIDIPRHDSVENVELAYTPKKKFNYLIINAPIGKSVCVVSDSAVQCSLANIVRHLNRKNENDVTLYVGKAIHAELAKYPVTRSCLKLAMYKLSDSDFEKIVGDAKEFDFSNIDNIEKVPEFLNSL